MQYELKPNGKKPKDRKLKEIHQIVQALAYGDAISSHAMAIRDFLRSSGYKSDIFVRYRDTRLVHEAKVFKNGCISQNAGILYHHSLATRLSEFALKHEGPKCLIYHNITPDRFYDPYQPDFAQILKKGRYDLNRFASHFPLSAGDSDLLPIFRFLPVIPLLMYQNSRQPDLSDRMYCQ